MRSLKHVPPNLRLCDFEEGQVQADASVGRIQDSSYKSLLPFTAVNPSNSGVMAGLKNRLGEIIPLNELVSISYFTQALDPSGWTFVSSRDLTTKVTIFERVMS